MLMDMSTHLLCQSSHPRIPLIGRMELWMMRIGLLLMILWLRDISLVHSWIVFNWLMIFKDVDNASSETPNSTLLTLSIIWLDSEKKQTIIFDLRKDVFKIVLLNQDIMTILKTWFLYGESSQTMITEWDLIFLIITMLIKSSTTFKTVFVQRAITWTMTTTANHVNLYIGTVLNVRMLRHVLNAVLTSTCWLLLKMIMWPVNQRWNSVISHFTNNLNISKLMNLRMEILNLSVKSVKMATSGKIQKMESIMETAFLADNQWIIAFNAIMDLTVPNVKMVSSHLIKETAVRKKSKDVPSLQDLMTTTDSSTHVLNATRNITNFPIMRLQEIINVRSVLNQSLDAESVKAPKYAQSALIRMLIMKN